ncbi:MULTISPECIES: TetR/AcrR family transcriptional regulator [Arthrobacter]|uniref:TetR/AcrR family transcriptional regulator n=1 Tax=unclassified Arthrobacter TaxID=235627 RepID=UPI0024BB53A6|nr:TetR/AcrR family transcriptional regulator [Arthrobacter sp. H35-MC1]MDJ0317503.1 TetR/AcrR family transcriptional regulator [Arthrobacter sp. H35-MC1]
MSRMAIEPRQDRSRITRERLLESAVALLSETGWTNTTVTTVATHAGVSRGATQHHFPTRDDLFTAAIEHMTVARVLEVRAALAVHSEGSAPVREVLDSLVGLYTGPLFKAALQVWTAAAVDPVVRAHIIPLEQTVAREAFRLAATLLNIDRENPRLRAIVAATLDLGRGLGLANILTDDANRRTWVLDAWCAELEQIIAQEAH